MKPKLWIFLLILFMGAFSLAQIYDSKKIKSLDEKIIDNYALMMTEPDKAFFQLDDLLEQAKIQKKQNLELALLSRKCWFYVRKSDLKKGIEASQILNEKAIEYKDFHYQALSHQHLIEIYAYNGLLDKAISEFEKSMNLLDKSTKSDESVNSVKAINHIKIANVYAIREDYDKLKYTLLQADKYINKLKENKNKNHFLYSNYSNLGVAYFDTKELDSAEYFIRKSLDLKKKEEKVDLIQYRNYIMMGQIEQQRNNFEKAIVFFRKAEKIESGIPASLGEKETLYSGFLQAYEGIENHDSVQYYKYRKQEILLEMEKNKNNSLHKIIDDELLKEKNYSVYIIIGSGILFVIMSVFIVRFYKKNKLLTRQEKISEQYLEEHKEIINVDENTLSGLVKMVHDRNPAFMTVFHNTFPDFLEKLKKIHPQIVPTEVEFCAMLKLNLLTKDIARHYNIEPKSVQNKKYRIRKKFNIPNEEDIYFWFSKI